MEEERRAKSKEMRRGNAKEKSWRREEKGTVGGIAHTIKEDSPHCSISRELAEMHKALFCLRSCTAPELNGLRKRLINYVPVAIILEKS